MTDKKPIEYSLKEIGDIKLDLQDVKMHHKWEVKPGFESTYYVPKAPLIKPCSFCGKIGKIWVVEGVQLLGGGDLRTIQKMYHQTLYLACESCSTARHV